MKKATKIFLLIGVLAILAYVAFHFPVFYDAPEGTTSVDTAKAHVDTLSKNSDTTKVVK